MVEPLDPQAMPFFGKMTASLSHELKNAMATINELSGLLEDLAAVAGEGEGLPAERVAGVCGRIQKQVRRAGDIVGRLNRFSHTTDEPPPDFDLLALVKDAVLLNQRFADMRKVGLQCDFPQEPMVVRGHPFIIHHLIHLAIDWAFDAADAERVVTVKIEKRSDAALVRVVSADSWNGPLEGDPRRPLLERLAQQVQARVSWDEPNTTAIALLSAGR